MSANGRAVTVRRAEPADVDFVTGLLSHAEVEPFLSAVRPRDRDDVRDRIERSQREPAALGVFVIEVDGQRAGLMEFERVNARSRIAHLSGLAVHPDFRGQRLADEAADTFRRHLLLDLGFHRLQLEVYGFNERGIAHAERAGFVREGTRRRAYRRHGGWADGVMFALLREDLGLPPAVDVLYEYVARHNLGVRTGDWEALGECFAEDGRLEFEGVQVGPFAGREAIVAAYRDRPPDDEVLVLAAKERPDGVEARYSWAVAPERPAGRMVLGLRDGTLERLLVTVDGAPG
ncbi:MAG TPA: GNAT family N-acetyltransferase [Gaiellaceae bacterium]|nr:GNAT family N-acetyltransferase [Gaiellaceae bacterium]